jgi:serine/threonine protein kinase
VPVVGELLADRYRIVARLGVGGMATVWRALDTRLDRDVAIKVLLPNLAADPALARRFDREARALAAVSHPNVVAVFDVDPGGDDVSREPFFVMELCDGGSLAELMEAGRVPPGELIPILAATADGLGELHARGLIHRDVKPHNILLSAGRAKLADFGIARMDGTDATTALTATNTTLGTLPYLAPELLVGERATPSSDVYALGVVAFQSLTGRLPRPTGMAELVEGRAEPPPAVSSVATELGTVFDGAVAQALTLDPAARPSASAFRDSLDAALVDAQPGHSARANAALDAAAVAAETERVDLDAPTMPLVPTIEPPAATPTTPTASTLAAPGRTASSVSRRRSTPDRAALALALGVLIVGAVVLAAASRLVGNLAGSASGSPSTSGVSPSPSALASPFASPPSPSPTPLATADTFKAARDALDRVRVAIDAARGGKDGLKGNEANELDQLVGQVAAAIDAGDAEAAREAAQALAERVDKLKLPRDRKSTLQQAVGDLLASLPPD